jgi:hypothetical protein
MRRRRVQLTILLAVLAFSPATAHGSEQALVSIPSATALTAYGGHVVWSEQGPSALWYLTDWHDGSTSRLPVAPRAVPFDVDLGPAADGRPVAVYSRCVPERPTVAPDWMLARGCDLYEFDFVSGKERLLAGVSSRRRSETTPSIWRGSIAFARRLPGRPKARLYLKRAGHRRLVRLPGGTFPPCDRQFCGPREPRPYAGADALDLGPRSLAFLWRLSHGKVIGTGVAWELRLDPLSGRRGTIASSGTVGGACEIGLPLSPNAVGRGVLFLERIGDCTVTRTPIVSFDARTGSFRQATPAVGLAYAIALDGRTIYWLRVPSPDPGGNCGAMPRACFLVRSSDLAFERVRRHRPGPPTF